MTEREMKELNTRCEMRMKQMHDMFLDLKHVVYGNGTEGLKTRVTRMEESLKDIQAGRDEGRKLFYGALISLILMVVAAVASQMFAFARAQAIAEQNNAIVAQQTKDLTEIKEALAAIEIAQ